MTTEKTLRSRNAPALSGTENASRRFAVAASAGLIALGLFGKDAKAQEAPEKVEVPVLIEEAPAKEAPAKSGTSASPSSSVSVSASASGANATSSSTHSAPTLFDRSKALRSITEYPYQLDMERILVHRPSSEADVMSNSSIGYTRSALNRAVSTLHGGMSVQFPALASMDGGLTVNAGIYGELLQMNARVTTKDQSGADLQTYNISGDGESRWMDGYQFGATFSARYRSLSAPVEAIARLAPSVSGFSYSYSFDDGTSRSYDSKSVLLPWSLEIRNAPLSDVPMVNFHSFGFGAHSLDPTRASYAYVFGELNASDRFKAVLGPHLKYAFVQDEAGEDLSFGSRLSPGGNLLLQYLLARNIGAGLGGSYTRRLESEVNTLSGYVQVDALFNRGFASMTSLDSKVSGRIGVMGEFGGAEEMMLPPALFVALGFQTANPAPYPYTPLPVKDAKQKAAQQTSAPVVKPSTAPAEKTEQAPAEDPDVSEDVAPPADTGKPENSDDVGL